MTYHHQTDAYLFQLFHNGDEDAFNVIYERYFIPLLNTTFQRVGSRDEAQEIVQDLFVGLYLKRSKLDNTANLSAYLQTLLRNKIVDRYRAQLTRKKHHDLFKYQHSQENTLIPEAGFDKKQLEATIAKVVRLLPEKCRQVFIMSRVHYLSHQAIAKRLAISVSTVEKHIVKALKIMRKQLEVNG